MTEKAKEKSQTAQDGTDETLRSFNKGGASAVI